MNKQKKVVIPVSLTLIISLCLTLGYIFIKTDDSKKLNYINKQLGIEINTSVTVTIVDDLPASGFWTPRSQKTTISKVMTWLTQSTLYKTQIPEANFWETVQFAGNIMPSHLNINWDGKSMQLQPATYLFKDGSGNIVVKYVEDVVMLEKDEQKSYIESHQLYKWLKNNEWKPEFKPN